MVRLLINYLYLLYAFSCSWHYVWRFLQKLLTCKILEQVELFKKWVRFSKLTLYKPFVCTIFTAADLERSWGLVHICPVYICYARLRLLNDLLLHQSLYDVDSKVPLQLTARNGDSVGVVRSNFKTLPWPGIFVYNVTAVSVANNRFLEVAPKALVAKMGSCEETFVGLSI
jgi:hypothetical protein